MKMILSVSLLSVFFYILPSQKSVTECAEDGFSVVIPEDQVREKIARVGDVDLEAAFLTNDAGARFWFTRGKQEIFSFDAKDLTASGAWIAVDHGSQLDGHPDQAHIALTYSDGGAIGGFHVRIFLIDANGVRDATEAIAGAVANFRARHYCKTRGNNVSALKWIGGGLLLLAEVYPTGDCGADLGHLEGYLVSVPEGKILEHLTEGQLRKHRGVCLENDD